MVVEAIPRWPGGPPCPPIMGGSPGLPIIRHPRTWVPFAATDGNPPELGGRGASSPGRLEYPARCSMASSPWHHKARGAGVALHGLKPLASRDREIGASLWSCAWVGRHAGKGVSL